MEENKRVVLSVEVNDVFTYALQQNGLQLVRKVQIKNMTESDIENLTVRIHTDIELAEPFEQAVEMLHAGEEMLLRDLKLLIKGEYLASLTALAYDEWPGLKYFPDLLAAFVTPNHPVITGFLQAAARRLEEWTGEPSLEGYQRRDPNRVKMMAAAAYAAIQEKNIAYAVPPSSFEKIGQRVCDRA